MLQKVARLFRIETRLEACAIIYALALGSIMRGSAYMETYPGWGGMLLFAACLGTVVLAGAKLLEITRPRGNDRRRGDRRTRVR